MLKNLSRIVLYVLCAITIVITLLFFLGGDVDPNADYVEPIYTNAMINLMYACFFLTALFAVVSAIWQFVIKLQSNRGSAIKTVVSISLTVLVLVVSYFISTGESITLLGSGEVVDEQTVKDLHLHLYWSIPILFVYTRFTYHHDLRMQRLDEKPCHLSTPIATNIPRMQTHRVEMPLLEIEVLKRKLHNGLTRYLRIMMSMDVVNHKTLLLWYGIITRTTPGMTTEDTTYSEIETTKRAMLLQCLNGILRTSRSKAA